MSGWCEWECTLLGWYKNEDHCPPGEHCDQPGTSCSFSGQLTVTLCVPD